MPKKIIYDKNNKPRSTIDENGNIEPYKATADIPERGPTDAGNVEPDLDRSKEIAEEDAKKDLTDKEKLIFDDLSDLQERNNGKPSVQKKERVQKEDADKCSKESAAIINRNLQDEGVNRPQSNGVIDDYGGLIIAGTIALFLFAVVPKKAE